METSPSSRINLLLASDEKIRREAFVQLIKSMFCNVKIYPTCDFQDTLNELTFAPNLDLVVIEMDISLLEWNLIMCHLESQRNIPVLSLLGTKNESIASDLRRIGVKGILSKNSAPNKLKIAIQQLTEGCSFFDHNMQNMSHTAVSNGFSSLTPRELQVLNLISSGNTNKEISTRLNLSIRTIESYRKSLMKKTNCRNAGELVSLAHKLNLV